MAFTRASIAAGICGVLVSPVFAVPAAAAEPSAGPAAAGPAARAAVNAAACTAPGAICLQDRTFAITYTVSGTGCAWTSRVDWGDGTTENVSYGSEGFTRSHEYAKAGVYQVSVTGSGTPTSPSVPSCTFNPYTAQVEAPKDHFLLEMKSWIPTDKVVDPYHVVPYSISTRDLVDDCGKFPDLVKQESYFQGDAHIGYEGSHRVTGGVEFDWDGQAVTNVRPVGPAGGVTTRHWLITRRGNPTPQHCQRSEADTATGSASGSGTNVTLSYRAADPLIFPAPSINNTVSATIGDDNVSLNFRVTEYPNQGFTLTRNGTRLDRRVYVNAACRPSTGPQGFVTLTAGLLQFRRVVVNIPTDTPTPETIAPCS
ncbi:hypothetical protein EDD29_8785 [Actinocorallia herbida]|uniref:PKD domain-containing protein n=1 Tax=Actinocorallia herbida TaxID=58109 RepID=A0A3N1DBZ5_9ACTN|nr:hypothetical protein [Actinocorallia herbida]ROO91042.1 hypothetical protein EDD29_8785 [Actinocorallia herbida]